MARTRKFCEPRSPKLSKPKIRVHIEPPKLRRLRPRRRQPGLGFGAAILASKDAMVTIMAMRPNAVAAGTQA